MGSCLIELFGDIVLRLLFVPLILVLATPYVLLAALFGSGAYRAKVQERYQRIIDFWSDPFSWF